METIAGLFEDFDDADQAVDDLRNAGFAGDDISVIAREDVIEDVASDFIEEEIEVDAVGKGALGGAVGGGAIGGLMGLLAGVGAIAIPGVGPAFAAGSVATALGMTAGGAGVGSAAGSLVGAMLGLSIQEESAHAYAEGVKRGGILILLETEESRADEAREILEEANAVDIEELRQTWKAEEGWRDFGDSNGPRNRDSSSAQKGSRMLLDGKVALITGAASGIGKASAKLMASEGATVGLLDLNDEDLRIATQDISQPGSTSLDLPADVSVPEQVLAAVEELISHFGRLDILFANAGINGVLAPVEELEPEEMKSMNRFCFPKERFP